SALVTARSTRSFKLLTSDESVCSCLRAVALPLCNMRASLSPPRPRGNTHAQWVKVFTLLSDVALPALTTLLSPLKLSALPYLPVVHIGPFTRLPTCALPDTSAVLAPLPSSKV